MNIYKEAKERAHAEGKIINLNEVYEIPDEYKPFIGKISDSTLYHMSYKYDVIVGKMVGPQSRIPTDVVEHLGESLKWNKINVSRLINIVLDEGLENIRNSKASEYMAMEGIGKLTVDALVEIGLQDDRDEFTPAKTMSVDCYVDGILYEEEEKFDFDVDTLEIHRAVELALGGKKVRGRFVGKIYMGKNEP